MKDFYRYLTVNQLKQQIKDTLVSAKQKLHHLENSRKSNVEANVNQKFYNYVKDIKNKQLQYSSLMNQTNELQTLLNRRKNKISQSLEKYQKSIRSKTLNSFYDKALNTIQSQENHTKYQFKLENGKSGTTTQQNSNEKYRTEPNSFVRTGQKPRQTGKVRKSSVQITAKYPMSNHNTGRNVLQPTTRVINIKIDSREDLKNMKLYSFAKDSIKAQAKKHIQQYDENKLQNIKKKLKMETVPSQNNTNYVSQPKIEVQDKSIQVPKQKKALKKIKARIKQNREIDELEWKTNKKHLATKGLFLKYQYQKFLKNDLRSRIISAIDAPKQRKRYKTIK